MERMDTHRMDAPATNSRKKLTIANRWVIKLGSALITNNGYGLNAEALAQWAAQIMVLKRRHIDVVLVSSGAVAEGMVRLGWRDRPHALHELQAAAAVGQMGLIQAYENAFKKCDTHTAQVLLTHDDMANRERYLNAQSTLRTLIDLQIVPIINENDTVATEEICFGDNDALAGLVANMIEADLLLLLTDQPGLYNKNPRKYPDAVLIKEENAEAPELLNYAEGGSGLGRGGMLTKIKAAATAAKTGANTVIAHGLAENIIVRIANGEELGTLLSARQTAPVARKQWLLNHAPLGGGRLIISNGAGVRLGMQQTPLHVADILNVEGDFTRGELISCVTAGSEEIARGLINYSAEEIQKIMGRPNAKIEQILGYIDEPELIHQDNLVLL